MKPAFFAIFLCLFTLHAQANLGETRAEVESHYGPPAEFEPGKGRTRCVYWGNDAMASVTYNGENRSQMEVLAQRDGKAFSDETIQAILAANAQGREWKTVPLEKITPLFRGKIKILSSLYYHADFSGFGGMLQAKEAPVSFCMIAVPPEAAADLRAAWDHRAGIIAGVVIASIIVGAIGALFSALAVQIATRIVARFKPAYSQAYLLALGGYVAMTLANTVFFFVWPSLLLQNLAGFLIHAGIFAKWLKAPVDEGESIGFKQGCLVALLFLPIFLAMFAAMFVAAGIILGIGIPLIASIFGHAR